VALCLMGFCQGLAARFGKTSLVLLKAQRRNGFPEKDLWLLPHVKTPGLLPRKNTFVALCKTPAEGAHRTTQVVAQKKSNLGQMYPRQWTGRELVGVRSKAFLENK